MNVYALTSRENDCRSCYKCIRVCPTKSISFHDGQASIIPNECVLCGRCFLACPQNCKQIRSDKDKAKELLAKGNCIASVAPSFLSSYKGASFETMKKALLALGFLDAEETAIGATIVKREYDRLVNSSKQDIILSTCCHSVNLLVEKHYPDAMKYLAPILSPMQAHAKDIKTRHPGSSVIFIGPCISKKNEVDRYDGYNDLALTFLELDELLRENGLKVEADPDPKRVEESLARLFPVEGGILTTMEKGNSDYEYIAVSGMENCISTIEDVLSGKVHHAFIEMSSCSGSCINGPAINENARSFASAIIDIKRSAGKKDFKTKDYGGEEISKTFRNKLLSPRLPSEKEIEDVLRKIGKTSKKDELNCACCGYPTCREKAIAVLQGKANLEMCLPYLMEREKSFAINVIEESPNGVCVMDESFTLTLANPSLSRILGKPQKEILGTCIDEYFDAEIFATALVQKTPIPRKLNLKNGHRVVEANVAYDEKYHILIAILHDITTYVRDRERKAEAARKTAEVTSEVIAKNMRAVQEIAQLLGESTAETKIALTKLQKSLQDEDDDR